MPTPIPWGTGQESDDQRSAHTLLPGIAMQTGKVRGRPDGKLERK